MSIPDDHRQSELSVELSYAIRCLTDIRNEFQRVAPRRKSEASHFCQFCFARSDGGKGNGEGMVMAPDLIEYIAQIESAWNRFFIRK